MFNAIEVNTPEGRFFVWSIDGRLGCDVLLPDRSGSIGYMNDIPEAARTAVQRAKEILQPSTSYPAILSPDPWENQRLRLVGLNTCNDCAGQAA